MVPNFSLYMSHSPGKTQWCGRCLAKDAHGRVSAELLCPYPPGVPAIVPGEVYTNEIVQQLQSVVQMGGKVTGAADETLRTLNVIR